MPSRYAFSVSSIELTSCSERQAALCGRSFNVLSTPMNRPLMFGLLAAALLAVAATTYFVRRSPVQTVPASVVPFLLRGINLLGIDSVMCPREERVEACNRLARDLPLAKLERMTETVSLADVPALAPRILKGEVRGRVVIDLSR